MRTAGLLTATALTAAAISLPGGAQPRAREQTFTLRRDLLATTQSLAWSPDGARLAVGWSDGAVRVYDGRTMAPLVALSGHRSSVLRLWWSSGGGTLVSEAGDWVRLHDPERNAPVGELHGVDFISGSPDGSLFVGRMREPNRGVAVFDLTGNRVRTLSSEMGPFAWNIDGIRLAAHEQESVGIWESRSGKKLATLDRPPELLAAPLRLRLHQIAPTRFASLAWHPTGSELAITSHDQYVVIHDPVTTQVKRSLHEPLGIPHSVAWSHSGKRLAYLIESVSKDPGTELQRRRTLVVQDLASGRRYAITTSFDRGPATLAWNPRREVLAVEGLGDGRILVWDPLRGNAQYLPWSGLELPTFAWSPDGEVLATIYARNIVKFWRPLMKP
jgi:WD40 repeat protein